ncbi:hypothetical protein RSOL_490640 [Rhizoctonia solani AG-3 Rhs1AP]|uniref:Uncharacterized protein n=1 Tax=Rhizoctonia solani AG-3 Rhs1AP TaxID=1086054 RepID=X8JI90_9AGAM|nr:hypothetical protein RSOL_490640 [Rhizoctonia solani AG-3 Rhs1AP]
MPLSPGKYTIYDADTGRVLAYYGFHGHVIGTWGDHQWYVKCYPGSSMYAIQNVEYERYLTSVDGGKAHGVGEDDASILELEHQFQNFYLIKLAGTKCYLVHPNIKSDEHAHTPVCFADRVTYQGCFWQFKRIGDDTCSILRPRHSLPNSTPSVSPPTSLPPQDLDSLYTNEAHFHTDMLFNMPRAPFSRIQRIAALDWARKLGATNVPTMASVDECERQLEAASRSNNSPLQDGTYAIRDTDSTRAIDYYEGETRIGTWDYHGGENQKVSAHT